ncbi:PBAN-type neuropeptides-like [Diprion similis]|uniref:PBAN-type neuropeptides-like n=1 Tax=Diprion similis TaxID=362088 RepID=UPI001EF8FA57|nr:PBAN-type neuropeptides-like [Diprion similis]
MILFTKHFSVCTSFALLITCATAEYDTRETELNGGRLPEENSMCSGTSCAKRSPLNGAAGSMWFGPRLGRRRRSDERLDMDPEETNAIADVINGAPWALVSIPGGKRHALQVFTPRLGRELGENYGFNSLSGDQGGNQDDIEQRSPPFAPRLGRRLPFAPSPRLGRELRALFQKV